MPSLIDRLRRLWGGPASGAGVGLFPLGTGQSQVLYGQQWDFLRIANSVYGNPTGYRCVEAIASNFSRPPWMILPASTVWPSASGEIHQVKKHPLLDVLNAPSAGMSATQFQRAIARDMELTGRSCWLKMQGSDGFGQKGPTTGLRRLPPQRVTVYANQDDELLGFVYTDRNGRQSPILPESLVYLRYPHPERIFDSMAPALVAGLPAETDTASARFNRDLLSNDAALPGYMILEGLTPEQFARWKAEWEAGTTPGKTRFLRGTQATYQKVGMTNQELTYDKLRESAQDDIMRGFGVPRAVAFDVSHETYANAEREQAIFMQHNMLPKWVLACDELTLQLGVEFGVVIALDLSGIAELQDSRDAVTERGIKLMSMKALTINEFRDSQGWAHVPWGDEPQAGLQPMSQIPLQPGAEVNPPPAQPALAPAGPPAPNGKATKPA